ncbi:M20/M25/M40 family metallo-hydrolase [Candidatus Woesearchaeota archaeon]|nr:M20/M25/M40 family metallo-hydrolase [Candidatus Woesearchaeota archaeon]
MKNSKHNTITLLEKLISIPSISGSEQHIADAVQKYLAAQHLKVKRHLNNLWCIIGNENAKKKVMLCSHLDTVKPSLEWKDPYTPILKDGKLHGLGATDTKSSVAAMIGAALRYAAEQGKHKDDALVLVFTQEEETGGNGMPILYPLLPTCDAAIVGEPTANKVCIAQKGLLIMKLIAKGKAAHASRPMLGENAITMIMEDLERIKKLEQQLQQKKKHPLLGTITITPTIITGGRAKNIIPENAEVTLDVRTIPGMHEEIISLVTAACKNEVNIISKRILPRETPKDHELLTAAAQATGTTQNTFIGSTGTSDWAFMECPCIKLGPGEPELAHVMNEYVTLDRVIEVEEMYYQIALSLK